MLQNPLIYPWGRFGAGAGAAWGHPFLVGAGAYLKFPRPLTPEFYIGGAEEKFTRLTELKKYLRYIVFGSQ